MAVLNASIDLPPQPESVRAARHLVDALMHAWGAPVSERRDDVLLLVTEIVSNAIEHVGGEASLALEILSSENWLRVSLADGSSIRPIVRETDGDAVRGRGMQFVAALSERWDAEDHQGGKRVWFELTL